MAEPVIQIEKLTRIFRAGDVETHALDGVSLTVERGEFVAITGSSGSGKSTLMAILGCLDRPSSGHYWFEGVDVAGLTEPELAQIRGEGWASCSRASTCWPAPVPSRTSRCRSSTRRRDPSAPGPAWSGRGGRSGCSDLGSASAIRPDSEPSYSVAEVGTARTSRPHGHRAFSTEQARFVAAHGWPVGGGGRPVRSSASKKSNKSGQFSLSQAGSR